MKVWVAILSVSLILILINNIKIVEGQKSGIFSVYHEYESWKIVSGKADNYVAVAEVETSPNATGWATVSITTNQNSSDLNQAFAAGYIEGALTTDLIYNSYHTVLSYFYNGEFSPVAFAWLTKNLEWNRAQVESCQNIDKKSSEYAVQDCDYWYQVGLVLYQLDGVAVGYNENCDHDKKLDPGVFLILNAEADIGDILVKVDPSYAPKSPIQFLEKDHCSVLIKYSEQDQQIYHSHATWGHYVNMLRVFKHYTLNYANVVSKTVSFSSFPGFLASGDDFFMTDRGLIVTETTNDVFNMSLYDYVVPTTVLYWIRVIVANRISDNGSTWVQTFSKYNSGTYNNQWQVTDTKLFTAGEPIKNGTLWILEQIPGFIVSEDATSFLVEQSFFPSYNVPYFPFIYNISGYPEQYEKYGDAYSYTACPRANIFRRDAPKVVTYTDMQNIMRYNEWQTDPFALGNPCNGISARCDLNTSSVMPFGAYDCKVSSTNLVKTMTTTALSGPTTLTQKPFSWTGPFADVPHLGQPTLFNFSFENMQPTAF